MKPYKINFTMAHTPTDHNIGWFLGRTTLSLSSKCMIKEFRVSTKQIKPDVLQSHLITIDYPRSKTFEGIIEINYYPWFPKEDKVTASVRKEISVRPRIENEFIIQCSIPEGKLWSASLVPILCPDTGA